MYEIRTIGALPGERLSSSPLAPFYAPPALATAAVGLVVGVLVGRALAKGVKRRRG